MLKLRLLVTLVAATTCTPLCHAQFGPQMRPFKTAGKVKSVARGALLMEDRSGKSYALRFAGNDGVVRLKQNRSFQAGKPVIEISGILSKASLKEGMTVKFKCYATDSGRVRSPVNEIHWVGATSAKSGITLDRKTTNERDETLCQVVGKVDRVDPKGFKVKLPRSRLAAKGLMAVPMAKDVKLLLKTRDLSKVSEGDQVTAAEGIILATGDYVVRRVQIQVVDKEGSSSTDEEANPRGRRERKPKTDTPKSPALDPKYDKLSNEPVAPRFVSEGFIKIKTDASDRDAQIMLDQGNELLGLLVAYYRRPIRQPLECIVVDELARWPDGAVPDEAVVELEKKRAITIPAGGASSGTSVSSKVFSANDVKQLRSEIVHSYSYQAFGSVGPRWYAHGMGEVGKYWRPLAEEVEADADYLKLLTEAEKPRSLKEVLSENTEASEEKEAAKPKAQPQSRRPRRTKKKKASNLPASRWALCYMLANNPNYNRQFLDLGVGLMSNQSKASLKSSYGKVSKQLLFEYELFSRNVENGYNSTICAWDWSHRFKGVSKLEPAKISILAKRGWQPGVSVEEGKTYEMAARGKWTIDGTGTTTSPAGDDKGVGKLVAVVMTNYELAEPIPVGTKATFTPKADGKLYLRCGERWGGLGDNAGSVTAYIRLKK